jgi:hypothetical protein
MLEDKGIVRSAGRPCATASAQRVVAGGKSIEIVAQVIAAGAGAVTPTGRFGAEGLQGHGWTTHRSVSRPVPTATNIPSAQWTV